MSDYNKTTAWMFAFVLAAGFVLIVFGGHAGRVAGIVFTGIPAVVLVAAYVDAWRTRRQLPWWYDRLQDDGSGRYDHTRTVYEAYGTDKYESVEEFERALESAMKQNEETDS